MKKFYESGAMYMLIALLFALAAINKLISDNPFVVALVWFCTAAFALLGFIRLRKTRDR